MAMKKVLLTITLVLAIVLINSMVYIVMAAGSFESELSTVSSGGGEGTGSFTTIMGALLDITRIIAAGVAVIMITAVAMKYLLAAPSEKAEIKKHAVVYVVGALVLFASSGILSIIKQFSNNINN